MRPNLSKNNDRLLDVLDSFLQLTVEQREAATWIKRRNDWGAALDVCEPWLEITTALDEIYEYMHDPKSKRGSNEEA